MSDDWSRRTVLAAAGGTATACAVALAPTASARLTRRMVAPAKEEFVGGEGYTGYFLHVGGKSSDGVSAQELSGCEFSDWPPDGIESYDGELIDRIQQDHRQTRTRVFTAKGADVQPGTLWVINRVRNCPDDHVGLEVEQVGAAFGNVSEDDPNTETDASPIGQPGFGPVATVAGLLAGTAGVARWSADDE